jgi:hypothetical protein
MGAALGWKWLATLAGALLVLVVLWEAFETIVSPRRVSRRFRLTRTFYRATWFPWRALGQRFSERRTRESFLATFGPLSLLALLIVWAWLIVLGFTLLQWGAGSGVHTSDGLSGLAADLYISGATLFTLAPSDVYPTTAAARVLAVLEAGTGLAVLTMVIGYLPLLSQAFSRREMNVSLLDARAGSPPTAGELLLRHADDAEREALVRLLEQWEQWCADLLETHVSFPVLAYYRSQHANQSWVAALTAILDGCAFILAAGEQEAPRAARLTFAMARHAVVDLALIFRLQPGSAQPDRLPSLEFAHLTQVLRDAGMTLQDGPAVEARLQVLRAMYEPYLLALGAFLLMPLPQWRSPEAARDNWRGLV